MMLYQLIILQFSAHLLADFIFQPQSWSNQKSQKVLSAHHFWHILVVFITSYLFSLDFGFWKAALLITVVHFGIDITKSYLQKKFNNRPFEKFLFFADQAIHVIILIMVSIAYSNWYEMDFVVNIPLKDAVIITGFILCSKPANIVIKNILTLYSIKVPDNLNDNNPDKDLPNAGKLIGVVERFLAFALILAGQYTAVGFIVAAKSILRFTATDKNEYVLVGTLLSFGIAVLTGILVNNF